MAQMPPGRAKPSLTIEGSPESGSRNTSPLGTHSQMMPIGASVKPDALCRAASKGSLPDVVAALEASWPSTVVLDEALNKACSAGQLGVMKCLLLHGASVEPMSHTFSCDTPLLSASEGGHSTCVEELLRRGAVVDRASPDGETSLSRAAYHGHLVVVGVLLEHNASLQASGEGGELGDTTPLQRAVAGDNPNLHSSKAWSAGRWRECISTLQQAASCVLSARSPRSLWAKVRDAVRVRPYALYWLSLWVAKRDRLRLDMKALTPDVAGNNVKLKDGTSTISSVSADEPGPNPTGNGSSSERSTNAANPTETIKVERRPSEPELDQQDKHLSDLPQEGSKPRIVQEATSSDGGTVQPMEAKASHSSDPPAPDAAQRGAARSAAAFEEVDALDFDSADAVAFDTVDGGAVDSAAVNTLDAVEAVDFDTVAAEECMDTVAKTVAPRAHDTAKSTEEVDFDAVEASPLDAVDAGAHAVAVDDFCAVEFDEADLEPFRSKAVPVQVVSPPSVPHLSLENVSTLDNTLSTGSACGSVNGSGRSEHASQRSVGSGSSSGIE